MTLREPRPDEAPTLGNLSQRGNYRQIVRAATLKIFVELVFVLSSLAHTWTSWKV